MTRSWRLLDPEGMTPQERMEAVIEILAEAVVRIVLEDRVRGGAGEKKPNRDYSKSVDMKKLFPEKKRFSPASRVPFGYRTEGDQRIEEKSEMMWIEKIKELRSLGLSMEKIAKYLNKVDKTSQRAGMWSGSAVWHILKQIVTASSEKH